MSKGIEWYLWGSMGAMSSSEVLEGNIQVRLC